MPKIALRIEAVDGSRQLSLTRLHRHQRSSVQTIPGRIGTFGQDDGGSHCESMISRHEGVEGLTETMDIETL